MFLSFSCFETCELQLLEFSRQPKLENKDLGVHMFPPFFSVGSQVSPRLDCGVLFSKIDQGRGRSIMVVITDWGCSLFLLPVLASEME